jgi:excinuclease ABC subunit A
MIETISIKGARVHNLKNIDLELPRNQLIVITGVSGSGKSSLAFDTIFAEGQRRYVESLSAYARQFLERMDRPDVDEIKGISPAMAIEQKNPVKTSRSTVGTATEIQDYLRLLFARVGTTICPSCGKKVKKEHPDDILQKIKSLPAESRLLIGILLKTESTEDFAMHLIRLKEKGLFRAVLDGQIIQLDEITPAIIRSQPEIFVLIDRLIWRADELARLSDSLELAFQEGQGRMTIQVIDGPTWHFSQLFECADCNMIFTEPQPRLFSFNNPFGACPECKGFGDVITIDMDRVIPDKTKSINQGAIAPWNTESNREILFLLKKTAPKYGIDLDKPIAELNDEQMDFLRQGDSVYPGIDRFFAWLEKKTYKLHIRVFLSRYRGYVTCPVCKGSRLKPEALYVQVGGKNIAEISRMSIAEGYEFFQQLELPEFQTQIAATILKEIRARLKYLVAVGLGYLSLNRRTQTLSGGEMKRINLATALGSQLVGTLYILDEPTIGLHARDTQKLLGILTSLRDLGNTVIVVEHDREVMQQANQIIDLGPGAGVNGGQIIYQGTYTGIAENRNSLTGQYLRGSKKILKPKSHRKLNSQFLKLMGAAEHNLKQIDVTFPLGVFIVITGVSGSGKSTLIQHVLYPALARQLNKGDQKGGRHNRLEGTYFLEDVILMDQSPIGRTPRSNPVTYLKIFDHIRQILAQTPMAKMRHLKPGVFSFNVAGGRCDTCEGAGVIKVEMQFLADLYLICESCGGKRYKKSILDIRYRGKNVADILELTITEANKFFKDMPKINNGLQVLEKIGLGYLKLGQPATTLSGGEAQRLKLAAHLFQKKKKRVLYIFDEPTTGLHFDDISKLLTSLNELVNAGNTVIVIEHNLDVIQCADYVIDLGPEGGDGGGTVVAQGTPEKIMQCENSYTGRFLRRHLEENLDIHQAEK